MDQPQTATPETIATITPAPAELASHTEGPPGTPWWAQIILARERAVLAWQAQAWRWAMAREPLLWCLLCEVYAKYGDQMFAWIPEPVKLQIAAAVFFARGLWQLYQTTKDKP